MALVSSVSGCHRDGHLQKQPRYLSGLKLQRLTIKHIPSTQGYSVITPVKQGFDSASCAGATNWITQLWLSILCFLGNELTWMNAVPTTTPEPMYLMAQITHSGTLTRLHLPMKTGSHAPRNEAIVITAMDEIRSARRPSYSLPLLQVDMVVVAVGVF